MVVEVKNGLNCFPHVQNIEPGNYEMTINSSLCFYNLNRYF